MIAPTTANESYGEAKPRDQSPARGLGVLGVEDVGELLDHLVAARAPRRARRR